MRLIDADLLKLNDFEILLGGSYKGLLQILLEKIEDAPTVDAVEVVRCKDCKFYWKNNRDSGGVVCLATPKDDAFCSEGERREDETN